MKTFPAGLDGTAQLVLCAIFLKSSLSSLACTSPADAFPSFRQLVPNLNLIDFAFFFGAFSKRFGIGFHFAVVDFFAARTRINTLLPANLCKPAPSCSANPVGQRFRQLHKHSIDAANLAR